ncbi:MAG: type IV pilin-like G/H family protein [Cyanobacteriota bacterium]
MLKPFSHSHSLRRVGTCLFYLFSLPCLILIAPAIFLTNIDPLLHSACEDRILKMNCLANQGEAKNNIIKVNHAQKAYYSKNANFTHSQKRLGAYSESKAYSYSIRVNAKAAFNLAIPKASYQDHKSYIGAVFVDSKGNLQSIECKSTYSGVQEAAFPTYQDGILVCGDDTKKVN